MKDNHSSLVSRDDNFVYPLSPIIGVFMSSRIWRSGFLIMVLGIGASLGAWYIYAKPSDAKETGGKQESSRQLLLPGKPIEEKGFSIDVPKNWRRFKPGERGSRVLHLVGDGMGLPPVDEKGGPLQVGLSVERFQVEESVETRVDHLKVEASHAPGRVLIGEIETEPIKLNGGVDGTMIYTTFEKAPNRKSFYEKLVVADPTGGTWVVTGWIVASPNSTLPRLGSALEKRLGSYVKSFQCSGEQK